MKLWKLLILIPILMISCTLGGVWFGAEVGGNQWQDLTLQCIDGLLECKEDLSMCSQFTNL